MNSFIHTVGSVCSGIEAASVAWSLLNWQFCWFSEIAAFPSSVLKHKYPDVDNIGDMSDIPQKILNGSVAAPDLICGGTPCQAFSLAGEKNGLFDARGNLTLKFVDIINANDERRLRMDKSKCLVFWENVEGVLSDKTNAFGAFISLLAGLNTIIEREKWPNAGCVHGLKRNVAWRVIDAKFFGVPQQRRRLYVLAGSTDFYPENILFEKHCNQLEDYPNFSLTFTKDGHSFEVFREYTDCLYSSYGTKWNGNAAAYNGSLFVVQDGRIRRFTPLECERLMGFPDDYTLIPGQTITKTSRYQALGNSWAVPVVRWIGERIAVYKGDMLNLRAEMDSENPLQICESNKTAWLNLGKGIIPLANGMELNCTATPEHCAFSRLQDIVTSKVEEELFISPVGCHGMVRRKKERNLRMNARLEEVLRTISSTMPDEEIESRSRVQKRGKFSADLHPTLPLKEA